MALLERTILLTVLGIIIFCSVPVSTQVLPGVPRIGGVAGFGTLGGFGGFGGLVGPVVPGGPGGPGTRVIPVPYYVRMPENEPTSQIRILQSGGGSVAGNNDGNLFGGDGIGSLLGLLIFLPFLMRLLPGLFGSTVTMTPVTVMVTPATVTATPVTATATVTTASTLMTTT